MKQLLSILVLLSIVVYQGISQGNHKSNHGLPEPGASSSRSMPVFNYDLTTTVSTYTELNPALAMPINNGEVWDQPTYEVPLEFPFELNGHSVSTLHFNGSGSQIASGTGVPLVFAELFPFESDLIDRGTIGGVSLSPISYIVEGVPGSRILKIE
ncbi:MAG TPA: hypothetical protein VFV79_04840, partial [Saprospiraceae bacterium]|nr:hypothetical protein [Saprospiraceae bacterium]